MPICDYHNLKNMNKILTFMFFAQTLLSFGQSEKTEEIFVGKTRYFTLGSNTDIINSNYGFTISNGIEEKPLLHFEELTYDIVYKLGIQSDLRNNNKYDLLIGWNNPSRRLRTITITLLSLEYSLTEFKQENFNQTKINLRGNFYIKPLLFTIVAKLGTNKINTSKDFGGEIGFLKSFKDIYFESYFGLYSQKPTYFISSQYNIYNNKIFGRLTYSQIDQINSLNLGFRYTFTKFR